MPEPKDPDARSRPMPPQSIFTNCVALCGRKKLASRASAIPFTTPTDFLRLSAPPRLTTFHIPRISKPAAEDISEISHRSPIAGKNKTPNLDPIRSTAYSGSRRTALHQTYRSAASLHQNISVPLGLCGEKMRDPSATLGISAAGSNAR